MKIRRQLLAFLLALLIALPCGMLPAHAAETYGYEVVISPQPAEIGGEVTLLVRLTDYTEAKSPLRGFQIDIYDVDMALSTAQCKSLVTDTTDLISNVAAYQPKRDLVRHLYAKMSGTMDYSQADLMEVRFTIPQTYTQAGVLVLPMRLLIQNQAGDKLTYNNQIEIPYVPAGGSPTDPPTEPTDPSSSVEITWGAMEFTYTDGTWNPETHMYENAGWTDNGTGTVSVSNTGKAAATAAFTYRTDRTDITGSFFEGDRSLEGPAPVRPGKTLTAVLKLSGKPSEVLGANRIIGSVTVVIGGE